MKTVNGLKYSREQFDDYTFSAKVQLKTENDYHNSYVYTTDDNQGSLLKFLESVAREDVTSIEILNWNTKEQDIETREFIDQWLKDI